MKQPDRFERMVEKVQRTDDWGIDNVSSHDVIKLLRCQHATIVQRVKRMPTCNDMDVWISKRELLAAMEQYRKGTR